MSALSRHTSHPKQQTAPSRASGTCSGEGQRRGMPAPAPEPFTPMPPLTAAALGQPRFRDLDRGQSKRPTLRQIGHWVGEIIAALSLFVALFGLLFLAEIFR